MAYGGCDLHWVEDPPDDLKCLICLCVARNPHQHPGDARNQCGKIFCLDCITKHWRNDRVCPNCRQCITLFPDARSTRAIAALKVKCENDCQWTGELGSLEVHRSTCPHASVSCKYAVIGCTEKPSRRDLSKHEENDQLHLRASLKKNVELTQRVAYLEHSNRALREEVIKARSPSLTAHIFKLWNYQRFKSTGELFYSQPFYTSYSGYKMCLSVEANGYGAGKDTHISVYTYLMKGDHDATLIWPFTGTVTVNLLNQLENKNHYTTTITFSADQAASQRVVDGERGQGGGIEQFFPQAALNYIPRTKIQYLKDDTLVFRVLAKVPNHKPWLDCNM